MLYRKTEYLNDDAKITLKPDQMVYDTPLSNSEGRNIEEEIKLKLKIVQAPIKFSNPALAHATISYDVHVFYYAWYGNPSNDNKWFHWNHEYIQNWNKKDTRIFPTGHHVPEKEDIGASFYPQLGTYR